MPSCSMDFSKSVDESPCPQYSDVATFDAFIDCQGNKYFLDNHGVCTQCQHILHLKPQFGLSTHQCCNCDVFPHHCTSLGPVFPFQRKWLWYKLFCPTHQALCSPKGTKNLKLCHPFVHPTMWFFFWKIFIKKGSELSYYEPSPYEINDSLPCQLIFFISLQS